MAVREYSLIIQGMNAAGNMGAMNGPPKTPGNGGPSASGDDGGGKSAPVDSGMAKLAHKQVSLQEKQPKFLGKMIKKMGINVGLSSILKQSQIFTGTIGSIFQIFGALVDVILAPFLPIIVPIIRLLGNLIPMIHKTINGIISWYDNNISPILTDIGQKIGGWISDNLLGWLPEKWQTAISEFFAGADWGKWIKNLFLGGIVLGVLSKFGFLKLLGPIGTILTKIPILGPLIKTVGGLAAGIGGAVARALGLGKLFPKPVKGAMPTSGGGHAGGAMAKTGGMFSKLKGAAGKLGPKSLISAAKAAGPMGILKGVAKKAIPGLSSALLMYQGVKGGIEVFKSNMEAEQGFWTSLGKSAAVTGTAAVGAGLAFAPGGALLAPIIGGMATDYMTKKMMYKEPESTAPVINVEVKMQDNLATKSQVQATFDNKERQLTNTQELDVTGGIYGRDMG